MARPAPLLVAIMALLAACAPRALPEPAVTGAWVRLPAVPGRPGAAYFTLRGGTRPVRLVAIDSPQAARTELHESMAGMAGMTMMTPLRAVAIAPGTVVAFAPEGRHAMLFGIAAGVRPESSMTLFFRFADGTSLRAAARVVAAGDPAPPGA